VKLACFLVAVVATAALAGSDPTQTLLSIQDKIQSGDLTGASSLIEVALKQNPNEGGLWNLRGIVHARNNELPQARADFEKAVHLSPRLTPAWQNLARACQLQAEHDNSALSCSVDSWRRVLHSLPDDTEAHASLALLYARTGDFKESLAEVRSLPPDVAGQPRLEALRCLDEAAIGRMREAQAEAEQLSRRIDFSESDLEGLERLLDVPASAPVALILLEGLTARNAASLPTVQRLAVAYERVNRPSDARQTLERVALLDPNNPSHLLELARLADAAKDYEGEIGYLGHARDLAPENSQIHYLFGRTASELNLPIEARKSFDKALSFDRANPAYNYAMGSVILTTRDAASAANYFQKYVNAKPADPDGHYALGIAEFASGDYDQAKQELRPLLENAQLAGPANFFLGRIARIEGDLADAKRLLTRSIAALPSFSESHTELARVYMEEKDLDHGRRELAEALRLDPSSFRANSDLLALYRRTHDPRAEQQEILLKKLDEDRSRRAELMLRQIELRP
jgi:tetratricopeptide (TPR) repeat protein